jgi:hypothetical protein
MSGNAKLRRFKSSGILHFEVAGTPASRHTGFYQDGRVARSMQCNLILLEPLICVLHLVCSHSPVAGEAQLVLSLSG